MKAFFTAMTALVALLFLAAVGLALAPMLTRDETQLLTRGVTDPPAGAFVEVERSDLFLANRRGYDYTEPNVPGAQRHQVLNGLMPRTWVSYAPTATDGPHPMVILFPGAGRRPMSMIDMWQEVAREEGLILVALPWPGSGDAAEDPRAAELHSVMEAAGRIYDIDQERVILFGQSAGGVRAQVVANRVRGPWRAAASHAGHVVPAWIQPIQNAVPVRHYLGSSDGIFSPANSRIAGQAAARAGHDHELIIIPGHTHWYYEIGPSISRDAWDWFESIAADDPSS